LEISLNYLEEKQTGKNLLYFSLGLLLNIVIVFVTVLFSLDAPYLLIGAGALVSVLFVFSYKINSKLFFLLMFINYYIYFNISVLFVIPLAVSFIISYRPLNYSKLQNQLTTKFIFYILTTLPSFYNTIKISGSLAGMYNFVAIIIVVYIISYTIDDFQDIKKYMRYFLVLGGLNAVTLIAQAVIKGGNRVFGITGVVFTDFASIIIIGLFVTIIIKPKYNAINIPLVGFFLLALLFTQTRSSLIICFITIGIFLTVCILTNKKLYVDKKKIIITLSILAICAAIIVAAIVVLSPQAVTRLTTISTKPDADFQHEADFGTSTLITRFLVWQTAFNAFVQHPIIGIGAYSFPFSSHLYQHLSPFLFNTIVKGLSPHVTYLAVLTETGIVGMIGFLFLLISSIKLGWDSIKKAITSTELYFSFLLFFIYLNIILSMFFSDAYLAGQCAMLWGVVLGLSVANNRIVNKNYSARLSAVNNA
jgi:O-Antigen ligase.